MPMQSKHLLVIIDTCDCICSGGLSYSKLLDERMVIQ